MRLIKRTPSELVLSGQRPIRYARLRDRNAWVGAYAGFLAIVPLRGSAEGTEATAASEIISEPDAASDEASSDAWPEPSSRQPTVIDWSEFEGAHWEEAAQSISFTFVDNTTKPLEIQLVEGTKADLAIVVRERLQRSIVFQMHDILPSRARARAMVRRTANEELFTQVIIEGPTSPIDEERLREIDAELRDTTGLPLES